MAAQAAARPSRPPTSAIRLIKHTGAQKILFLVDRDNLDELDLNEFQHFVSPLNGYKFTEEYPVQHLKCNTIAPAAKVCIMTIQRLYSMLKGEEEFAEENKETPNFKAETSPIKEPLPVVYNPRIPIETFDFILVDECHRSLYNVGRQVLEYFDAARSASSFADPMQIRVRRLAKSDSTCCPGVGYNRQRHGRRGFLGTAKGGKWGGAFLDDMQFARCG